MRLRFSPCSGSSDVYFDWSYSGGVLELVAVGMNDLLVRFAIGGFVVSCFAVLGAMLKPKSFAGLFSAAPSVALASLGLAVAQHGKGYAGAEARSMILGALAFVIYGWVVSRILFRTQLPVLPVTTASLAIWLVSALGLWFGLLR